MCSESNRKILEYMSEFLTLRARSITADMVREMQETCGVSPEEAFRLLLASFCGLDIADSAADRALYNAYFPAMTRLLDADAYAVDPYYRDVAVSPFREGKWEWRMEKYDAYEAFVWNDLKRYPDGRIVPQIGFFAREFAFPALLENGREWMTITPNEIETMHPAIAASRGRVLTYGLGMGYFAYMAARRDEVESVTVVERDGAIIDLFRRRVLPFFAQAQKIEIVHSDAFEFARTRMGKERYDVVFTDLWHDPSDGIDMYLRMKSLEGNSPESEFHYWIEGTIREYL